MAQELRTGIRSPADRRQLEPYVLDLHVRRGRVVTPSAPTWNASGDLLSDPARRDRLEVGRVSKAFGNDGLHALSSRNEGMVLVTENGKDFARIARVARFEFVEPWPAPRG